MDNICDQKYYSIYDFPPPEMRKGCEAFIDVFFLLNTDMIDYIGK